MRSAIRFIAAVTAGLGLAFVGVIAVEFYSSLVHPLPPEVMAIEDPQEQMAAVCAHVADYPGWVLASVVPMWLEIVFVAVVVARRIDRPFLRGLAAALTVALLLLAALGFNLAMLPYPWWFIAAMLLGFPMVVWLASRDARVERVGQEAPPADS